MSIASQTTDKVFVGSCVVVRARPSNYKAKVEIVDFNRFTVRPLPDQAVTTRARAIWGKAIVKVLNEDCSQ